MEEDQLIKEAEEALQELESNKKRKGVIHLKGGDPTKHNPFSYLLALILILLIIMMVVPFYGVKLDPEPKNIPSPSEVIIFNPADMIGEQQTLSSRADYLKLLTPDNQDLRNMAAKIATRSCRQSEICYSKAIYYFVRDNYQYVSDPPNDCLESPFETLYMGGADCDGLAILLANLQLAIGIPVRLTFIPGHMYVQVKIDEALHKYKDSDGWISLDPACKQCAWGEVPYSTYNKNREFLYT